MSEIMRLLVIDDNQSLLDSWGRDIAEFNENAQNEDKFELTVSTNAQAAAEALAAQKFNFIIADLRLPATEGAGSDAQSGNNLIASIIKSYPIVTAIVSGHPGEIESPPGVAIKQFSKSEVTNQDVLGWLYESRGLAFSMIALVEETQGLMANFLHRSVRTRWEEKWKGKIDQAELSHILIRMGFAYISEEITHSPDYAKSHHPEEFYIYPSVRQRLHTGDIVTVGGEMRVVLTPPCDMANADYPEFALFVKIENCLSYDKIAEEWKKYADQNNPDKRSSKLRGFLNHNINNAIHFIPPLNGDGPWVVNFKNIKTEARESIEEILKTRVASISPYFLSNLIDRFSSYVGRIGQPNLDVTQTNDAIVEILTARAAAQAAQTQPVE